MERLYQTVIQIEVAKRSIEFGDVAHLRVALILLDNAVEVMMHRAIQDELRHVDAYARMLRIFPTGPLDPKGEELRREMSSHVVSNKRQDKIRRYFDEKVDFLSKDRDRIPLPSARALKHLHYYRNETQHQGLVREDSVHAAVMLLFDIATDFLVRLHPGSMSWIGGEDYSWVEKYGIESRSHRSNELRERIAERLRADLPLDITGIRKSLIVHLTERLDAMERELDFVIENLPSMHDRAQALKLAQFWHSGSAGTPDPAEFQAFVAPHDLSSFTKWRAAVEALNSIEDKLDMFDQFATIEDDFEPLENIIVDVAEQIDAEIELASDIARGK